MEKNGLRKAIEFYEAGKFEEAYTLFKNISKNSEAQYYIGMLYYEGDGVKKDINQASYWFKKASRQGNLDAEYMQLCCMGTTSKCCKG